MNGRDADRLQKINTAKKILKELPEYVENYYNQVLSIRLSPGTSVEYLRRLRLYLKWINPDMPKIKISETASLPLKYISEKRFDENGEMRSFAYQKGICATLKSFYDFLEENEIIEKNLLNSKNKPHGVDRVFRPQIMSDEANHIMENVLNGVGTNRQHSFQKTMKERDRLIISLLLFTGMRRQALCNLDVADIIDTRNSDGRMLLGWTDKGNKNFSCDITNLANLVDDWLKLRTEILKGYSDDGALFLSLRRTRITSEAVALLVRKYTEDLSEDGKGYGPHKLRAAFITILYDKTKDIELVRQAVNHSNINTTAKYISRGNQPREIAAKVMSGQIKF